jgi:uncharacterized SAM-binding protein YcdF (DUF218 family)
MDSFFYWLSKLIWLLASPDSLLLIFFGVVFFLLWYGKNALAKKVLGILLGSMLTVAAFPIGEWLLYPLETKYAHNPKLENVDGIIVLAGSEHHVHSKLWDQVIVGEAIERNLAFMMLARLHPEAKLVFSGGVGSMLQQDYKAADVAKRLYQEQGMSVSKIIFERESRNTWQSALLSKSLVNPEAGTNWVLITTAWHMPRSMGIFCKVGWKVTPYPVDYYTQPGSLMRLSWGFASNLNKLVIAVKEWIGLVTYKFTGKSC